MEDKPKRIARTICRSVRRSSSGRCFGGCGIAGKARRDVQAELTAHFEDAVRDCATAEEKESRARELIEGFGDARLLASLCHRAKKRCRPLWLKALVRSGQGLGLALLYCVVCMLPLLLARPTIRVNYGQWLSNHWRPEGQDVENAKVYYDKAAALLVAPPEGLEGKIGVRRLVTGGLQRQRRAVDRGLADQESSCVSFAAAMCRDAPLLADL